ncbi:MAG TPA: hypothetical protein VKW78_21605 [Terriglobales bacterium]|nr:hypothetical protein [Terriglobales bacterium]
MNRSAGIGLVLLLLAVLASPSFAQSKPATVQPEARLTKLLPATVFLDGENVPTQKRNSSLVELQNGKLLLAALVDTAGYSSGYQEKYIGVIESQGGFTLGGKDFGPGAYGFGRKKTNQGDKEIITLCVYDLGGNQLAEVPMDKNESLKPVRPLQIAVQGNGARLYLGPYYLDLAGK